MTDIEKARQVLIYFVGRRFDIIKDTGLKSDWLCSVAMGRIKSPSPDKIQLIIIWAEKEAVKLTKILRG